MKAARFSLLPLLLFLFLFSCARVRVVKPDGFAEVKSRGAYRAVSPEGMLFRVRTEKNYPAQDLQFWGETLKNHLTAEGYLPSGNGGSFRAGPREGLLYEWVLPYGNDEYIYLTALVVTKRRIIIAESSGEHRVYRKHREAVIESLKSISP